MFHCFHVKPPEDNWIAAFSLSLSFLHQVMLPERVATEIFIVVYSARVFLGFLLDMISAYYGRCLSTDHLFFRVFYAFSTICIVTFFLTSFFWIWLYNLWFIPFLGVASFAFLYWQWRRLCSIHPVSQSVPASVSFVIRKQPRIQFTFHPERIVKIWASKFGMDIEVYKIVHSFLWGNVPLLRSVFEDVCIKRSPVFLLWKFVGIDTSNRRHILLLPFTKHIEDTLEAREYVRKRFYVPRDRFALVPIKYLVSFARHSSKQ